jgi:hypothetical protein
LIFSRPAACAPYASGCSGIAKNDFRFSTGIVSWYSISSRFVPHAAIGAIFGSALPLALSLAEPWQAAVLAGAALLLLVMRRAVVTTLVAAGAVGLLLALAGAPVPR